MTLPDELSPLLYAGVVAIPGAHQGLLCDLQRGDAIRVPNLLCDLMNRHRGATMAQLRQLRPAAEAPTADQIVALLIKRELAFLTAHPDRFPALTPRWDHPTALTHALIDLAGPSPWLEDALAALDALGCDHLGVRLLSGASASLVERLMAGCQGRRPRDVELHLTQRDGEHATDPSVLVRRHARLTRIIVYGADRDASIPGRSDGTGAIELRRAGLRIDPAPSPHRGELALTVEAWAEAHTRNLYFAGKLHVTAEGLSSQGPGTRATFGPATLEGVNAALGDPAFTALWGATKERTEGCCECERRYSCIDPLPPVPDGEGGWRRSAPCDYVPATGVWRGE